MSDTAVMTLDDHATGVGKIVGNLQALELVLRLFLGESIGQKLEFPNLTTEEMPETFITNFMSLGVIIEKYNAALLQSEKSYSIGIDAVKIRDAIAHGRVSSLSPTAPMTLYKFGRADSGTVPIEYSEVLSMEWFNEKRLFLRRQMEKVLACAKARNYKFIGVAQ
jgi:hypothetical protein